MSADNGVYILKTTDNFKVGCQRFVEEYVEGGITAYRVATCGAIDNFDWYKKNQEYMLGKYMNDIWGESEVFYTFEEAIKVAMKTFNNLSVCEYGINEIDASEYSFN